MNSINITPEENLFKLKQILNEKVSKGFTIEEINNKMPFAVLCKKGIKVNHNINFLFSCVTLGLWSIPWIYKTCISSKDRKIVVAIDEDGNPFVDKCYSN